jgi:hypothetical protein
MPQDLVTWLPPVETGANGSASAPSVCADRTLDDALCRAVWVHRRLEENTTRRSLKEHSINTSGSVFRQLLHCDTGAGPSASMVYPTGMAPMLRRVGERQFASLTS